MSLNFDIVGGRRNFYRADAPLDVIGASSGQREALQLLHPTCLRIELCSTSPRLSNALSFAIVGDLDQISSKLMTRVTQNVGD